MSVRIWIRRFAGRVGLAAMLAVSAARAHGEMPRADVIAFEPANPSHAMFVKQVRRT